MRALAGLLALLDPNLRVTSAKEHVVQAALTTFNQASDNVKHCKRMLHGPEAHAPHAAHATNAPANVHEHNNSHLLVTLHHQILHYSQGSVQSDA
jgi:hypothetical protein